ncbi:hypothetical protein [Streptomyces genisteinicus]|uniref:Uncharacterized protein n=1 Tax=Streptomyces genisteinicus TaxID=2768068 RepID=A0A7H0HRV3_9ACTN|nr:hypothetical protein [Streptomyces genisteinicus]QNP63269.1 hypothetical protein IAG43_10185 [Streptomyces genisteinicus]
MRRARPGDTPRGHGRPPGPRAPGEERTLTSVGGSADLGGHPGEPAAASEGAPSGALGGSSTATETAGAREAAGAGRTPPEQPLSRLWHITLSVSGPEAPLKEVRRGLEQLAHDHPFLLTSRYANDHAEIRYWEEARDLHDAAAVALRLWGEHRSTARLPPWEIVGLEVVDRQTYHLRVAEGYGPPPASPIGVHPF